MAKRAKADDRLVVRDSEVHGRGVFAGRAISADEELIHYGGRVISWDEAQDRWADGEQDDDHTFFFDLGDGRVIDGDQDGNDARWINHGCQPNCETTDEDGRIVIRSLRKIKRGEELFIDYQLTIEGKVTKKLRKQYACRCGAKKCRGTMLAG
ncbi:SET domain-containing protein [uncultured Jatrophihabitans sp.]|uniref:SET domain-containing protein n=1 Tax=uncultured Jatrophihabitans sp. TaxID=1610747 RepID=UPI0035C974DD